MGYYKSKHQCQSNFSSGKKLDCTEQMLTNPKFKSLRKKPQSNLFNEFIINLCKKNPPSFVNSCNLINLT